MLDYLWLTEIPKIVYLSEKGSVQSGNLEFFSLTFFTVCKYLRYFTKPDSLYQGTDLFSVFGHFDCSGVPISSLSFVLLSVSVSMSSFLFSEPTLQWLSDTLETFLVSRQTTLWCPSAMSKCGKNCLFFKINFDCRKLDRKYFLKVFG